MAHGKIVDNDSTVEKVKVMVDSASITRGKDGFILCVYYIFCAGIHLGASSKRLQDLCLQQKESTEEVGSRSQTRSGVKKSKEAGKAAPKINLGATDGGILYR